MEASRKLHLVDVNGEATEVCSHCAAKDQAIERLTRSYEGTIQRLKMELDDKKEQQAHQDPQVLAVVEDWCRRVHDAGIWSRLPKPTVPRLDATRTAMNKGHDPGYLLMVNIGAVIGAVSDRKQHRLIKPQFLEPATIYGKYIDAHFEVAVDPERKWVRAALEVPSALRERWQQVIDLADRCDHCDHIRLDHDRPSLVPTTGHDWGECRVHGCHCTQYDDFWFQSERWMDRNAGGRVR